MDFELLKQVNVLWEEIYPFLASQIAASYQKNFGKVLELGPFSGGVSLELAKMCPEFQITIADESSRVIDYLNGEMKAAGLYGNIEIGKTSLDSLNFNDFQFDLVIFRGGFFFLDEKGKVLREIFRVIKKGGMAFVGGGYGKDTPGALINKIAEKSRELNERLGRKRVSIKDLQEIIRRSGVGESCRIVEQGGLWVVMGK